jgi:hypothetical protein
MEFHDVFLFKIAGLIVRHADLYGSRGRKVSNVRSAVPRALRKALEKPIRRAANLARLVLLLAEPDFRA